MIAALFTVILGAIDDHEIGTASGVLTAVQSLGGSTGTREKPGQRVQTGSTEGKTVEILAVIGNSLSEAFFMFWATLWALILGFLLSGVVQSFVTRDEMQKLMGDHRAGTIARSGLLGMASSSCSYAATALAKSLFQRGADFTASIVFMIASTNLVIELGIVLWLLLGWQFALAEFVGGAMMIVAFWLLAPRVFPVAEIATARRQLNDRSDFADVSPQLGELRTAPLRQRLRSAPGWVAAASYAVSDLKMLRRELAIGYLVAGFLAVAVPTALYQLLFFQGHGFLTDLENVIVGPLIAFVSFVCSVGNVPLAAALFHGGFSFGGTVAFVFADLITLPLVLIYAKFYGRRIAIRLFVVLWAIMSAAGLAVDYLFRAIGIPIPKPPTQIAPTHFAWDYTTFLNIGFLALGVVAYIAYRNRHRFGLGAKYATDPVCGMQVERANAPATSTLDGATTYFCCDQCRDKFELSSSRYRSAS